MKTYKFLQIAGVALLATAVACDEDDPFNFGEADAETELSERLVETEEVASYLFNTVDIALRDSAFQAQDSTTVDGASVTRDGNNITIDYGNATSGSDGVVRSGSIDLVMTGSDYTQAGTTLDGTFNNFEQDDTPVSGNFRVENKGNDEYGLIFNDLSVNPDFVFNSDKTLTWSSTNPDSSYTLSGTSSGVRTGQDSMDVTISRPLVYDRSCQYGMVEGVMDVDFMGDSLSFSSGSIDFLDSDGCNNLYELTVEEGDNVVTLPLTFKGF